MYLPEKHSCYAFSPRGPEKPEFAKNPKFSKFSTFLGPPRVRPKPSNPEDSEGLVRNFQKFFKFFKFLEFDPRFIFLFVKNNILVDTHVASVFHQRNVLQSLFLAKLLDCCQTSPQKICYTALFDVYSRVPRLYGLKPCTVSCGASARYASCPHTKSKKRNRTAQHPIFFLLFLLVAAMVTKERWAIGCPPLGIL